MTKGKKKTIPQLINTDYINIISWKKDFTIQLDFNFLKPQLH